jgi:transposase
VTATSFRLRNAAVLAQLVSGVPATELAVRYRVSRARVYKIATNIDPDWRGKVNRVSQRALARQLGVSRQTVAKMLNGRGG